MFSIRNRVQYRNNNCMKSYIRILHAVPNAPAVDVYTNDTLIAKNLSYTQFTEYIPIYAGDYRIQIYPAGTKREAVYDTKITMPPNEIYTAAAIGQLPDISVLAIQEPKEEIPMGMAAVRFSHLSPTAPNVDITLPDGTILFDNIAYTETTEYLAVPPSVYTLQARVAGTDNVVLTVPNIKLYPGKYYTVYAVGLPSENPPLQVLIPLDGVTYIPLC